MRLKNGWNNRVLIVDDQENIHKDFDEMLKTTSSDSESDNLARLFGSEIDEPFLPEFEIFHVYSGKDAYAKIEEAKKAGSPIAVAYIDIRMPPGWDGVETIRKIREIDKDIEIVIMTAHTDKSLKEINRDMELLYKLLFIRKPVAREEIQQITMSLVEKWNIERESIEKSQQLEINKRRLETVLDSTLDAIGMFDIQGNMLFANRCYGKMFGLLDSELQKMPLDELKKRLMKCFMDPDMLKKLENLALDKSSEEIIELKWPERKIFYQFMAPIYDAEENVTGRIIVYRDVSRELEIDQMKAEVLRLRSELEKEYSFNNIIGKSKRMQDVFVLMQQSSRSDITVLILGESGTGKELVAKSIHFNSPRKSGSFVAVNCAAIPETLIESELFGHEKGSFTGAYAQRIGKFEQANGGTILLDEIGEMHPLLQTRLLRVLQEREIQRIGGRMNIPIDVRIIASTNKNLEAAMKSGQFREDLYYRIAAFPLTIPPLRERREDIPLLAEHFLNYYTQKTGKSISIISSECQKTLINYDWPGNVRELENAIERSVLLETSEALQVSNLPHDILASSRERQVVVSKDNESELVEVLSLEEVERQAIINALKITGNNIRQAAKILKINRATIYRKMERYNMPIKE
jgi:PAS domain S-box-containing protein